MVKETDYPYIRNIPPEVWKRKEWPIGMDPELPLKEKTAPPISLGSGFAGRPNLPEGEIPEEHEPEPEVPKQRTIRFPYNDD